MKMENEEGGVKECKIYIYEMRAVLKANSRRGASEQSLHHTHFAPHDGDKDNAEACN